MLVAWEAWKPLFTLVRTMCFSVLWQSFVIAVVMSFALGSFHVDVNLIAKP
jgi:hypothetical protein